jgi:hypothetical protein
VDDTCLAGIESGELAELAELGVAAAAAAAGKWEALGPEAAVGSMDCSYCSMDCLVRYCANLDYSNLAVGSHYCIEVHFDVAVAD